MAKYLLDTNIVIDVLRNRAGRQELLTALLERGSLLACSPITIAEIYAGLRSKEETTTEKLLSSFELLPLTSAVCRTAGLFRRDFLKIGKTLSLLDCLIAATAQHYDCILITENIRDFPMKEVSIYSL